MDTTVLHLEALPAQTTKGTIVRLLEQVGELPTSQMGAIDVRGRIATFVIPAAWAARLVKALDGVNLGNHCLRAWSAPSDRAPRSVSAAESAAGPATRGDHF